MNVVTFKESLKGLENEHLNAIMIHPQIYRRYFMNPLKTWIEDALWSWKCCIHSRFVDYNDNIDRCAFFEELNYGWVQMKDEYIMSQPGFDPYNLSGRDPYYTYMMRNK